MQGRYFVTYRSAHVPIGGSGSGCSPMGLVEAESRARTMVRHSWWPGTPMPVIHRIRGGSHGYHKMQVINIWFWVPDDDILVHMMEEAIKEAG